MLSVLTLYLDFEGARNIYVLSVLIWSFEGHWGFLTVVWHRDLDLDMVTGLWYTHLPNLGSLSWFWRWKEHSCPLSPHFGLWRTLEVPDGEGAKNIHVFKFSFGALEDARVSWLGFGILILIWIWSLVFDTPMIWIWAPYLHIKGAKIIHVL